MKRLLSWRPDGITRAQLSDELTWKRAEAISSAGGTPTYLVLNRLDIAYPQCKPRRFKAESANESEAEENCTVFAGRARVHLEISLSRDAAEIGEEG